MNFISFDSTDSTPLARANRSLEEKSSIKRKSTIINGDGKPTPKKVKLTPNASTSYKRLPKIVRLHHEINDFVKENSPHPEERQMREQVVERVKGVVQSLWPDSTIEVFGSYRTDLYLPSCDIDIVVFGKWQHKPLYTLKDKLVATGITKEEDSRVIEKAAVPIIKLVDSTTKVKVDIAFNTASGLTSANEVLEYLEEFPNSKALILVLKQFLSQRDLNEVFTGGVSSYGLMLMVISFLQLHPRGDGHIKEINLGVLLLEFFELYGCHFNYMTTGIVLRGENGERRGSYFQRTNSVHLDKFCLPIYDPASEEENEVLKGSFNLFQVQLALKQAYKVLTNEIYSKSGSKNILSLIIDLDCR